MLNFLNESSTQTNPRLAFIEFMLDSIGIKGNRKYLDIKSNDLRLGKYKTTCKVNDSEFQLYADIGIDFKFFRYYKETDDDIIDYKTGDFLDKDLENIYDKVRAFFKQNKVQVDNIRDYTSPDTLRQGFQCSISIPTMKQCMLLSTRGIKGKYLDAQYSNTVYLKYTDSLKEDNKSMFEMKSFKEWLNEDYRSDVKKECAKLVKGVSSSFKFSHQGNDNGVDQTFWYLAYESNGITLKIGLEQRIVSYIELEDEFGNVSAKDFSVLIKKLYTALTKLSSNFKKYDLVSDSYHYEDDEPKTYRLESPYDPKSVFSF